MRTSVGLFIWVVLLIAVLGLCLWFHWRATPGLDGDRAVDGLVFQAARSDVEDGQDLLTVSGHVPTEEALGRVTEIRRDLGSQLEVDMRVDVDPRSPELNFEPTRVASLFTQYPDLSSLRFEEGDVRYSGADALDETAFRMALLQLVPGAQVRPESTLDSVASDELSDAFRSALDGWSRESVVDYDRLVGGLREALAELPREASTLDLDYERLGAVVQSSLLQALESQPETTLTSEELTQSFRDALESWEGSVGDLDYERLGAVVQASLLQALESRPEVTLSAQELTQSFRDALATWDGPAALDYERLSQALQTSMQSSAVVGSDVSYDRLSESFLNALSQWSARDTGDLQAATAVGLDEDQLANALRRAFADLEIEASAAVDYERLRESFESALSEWQPAMGQGASSSARIELDYDRLARAVSSSLSSFADRTEWTVDYDRLRDSFAAALAAWGTAGDADVPTSTTHIEEQVRTLIERYPGDSVAAQSLERIERLLSELRTSVLREGSDRGALSRGTECESDPGGRISPRCAPRPRDCSTRCARRGEECCTRATPPSGAGRSHGKRCSPNRRALAVRLSANLEREAVAFAEGSATVGPAAADYLQSLAARLVAAGVSRVDVWGAASREEAERAPELGLRRARAVAHELNALAPSIHWVPLERTGSVRSLEAVVFRAHLEE